MMDSVEMKGLLENIAMLGYRCLDASVVQQVGNTPMHRTREQDVTRFCVAWLRRMQGAESDLRSEASVQLAKTMLANTTAYDLVLPRF